MLQRGKRIEKIECSILGSLGVLTLAGEFGMVACSSRLAVGAAAKIAIESGALQTARSIALRNAGTMVASAGQMSRSAGSMTMSASSMAFSAGMTAIAAPFKRWGLS